MKPARLAVTVTLFALAALAALPLHAANFCVSTGNQLNNALSQAGSNAEDDTIKIEYGTLTSNVQAPQNYQWIFDGRGEEYATTISGGWTKGNSCASIATNDPAATVLDAQWWGPTFLADLRYDFSGIFTMRNLTLARGKTFNAPCMSGGVGIDCASGLGVEAWALIGASVVIDNVLITTGRVEAGADSPVARLRIQGGGYLRFRNSIVMGNTLGNGDVTSGVEITALTGSILFVSNNSIFGNTVTSDEVGLIVDGVATASNNAVADNASAGASAYQFTARNVSLQTLRNNHFATRRYVGGGYANSESGTTTGDAQWTQVGVRMVPDAESVLRDSGVNSPAGGIPSIDFSGYARIINGVIDRGAVEAAAVAPLGPSVTPSSPANGSTTVVYGSPGTTVQRTISFSTSGGTLGGTTELLCGFIVGTGQVSNNGSQTIPTGGSAGPVTVSLPITSNVQDHTVMCSAARLDGPVSTFFFHYHVAPDLILSNGFETGP